MYETFFYVKVTNGVMYSMWVIKKAHTENHRINKFET